MKKQRSKSKDKSVGTIQIKIGLFKYSSETETDLGTMFAEVVEAAKKAERSVFSTPPVSHFCPRFLKLMSESLLPLVARIRKRQSTTAF